MGELYYLGNARSEHQREEMVRLEAAGICLFCRRHMGVENGGKPILFESDTWVVAPNDYPYPGTVQHVMLIPKEHVTAKHLLSEASRLGYWEILERVVAEFRLSYYGQGCRNGDPTYTGATIRHLHEHIIVGDPTNSGDAVRLYLSSVPPATEPLSA